MAGNEDFDDDFFADVYAEDAPAQKPSSKPAPVEESKAVTTLDNSNAIISAVESYQPVSQEHGDSGQYGNDGYGAGNGYGHNGMQDEQEDEDGYGPIGIKEDGKMFIGGLNWETTDESLKDYFSQFGEVTECTVMRDGASGRSRGFGFLTFKDPKVVNTVMVKEHFLDGKIIDPKRAIPREEQERTAKIFVGGVSPEATEQDFKNFFEKFGRVIDATLMMDKDTGRPRGFGFVTFDGDEAVDRTLSMPLQIKGKPIEVKRAQPRSTLQAQAQEDKKFGRQGGGFGRGNDGGYDQQGGMQGGPAAMGGSGISPAVMAKYWHNMQQYFKMMQQQMATGGPQTMGMPNPMAQGMNPMMAAMMNNPAAMMGQQMMAQNMGQMMAQPPNQGNILEDQQSQMQQESEADESQQDYSNNGQQDGNQKNFDRETYARTQRNPQQQYQQPSYGQGGPTSWDGMYDDIPQPNMGGQGGGFHRGRGGFGRGGRNQNTPPQQPANAPANAPTGPKNAGRGGYRGGGRGGNRGYHPYSR